jgi:hypothetical protein
LRELCRQFRQPLDDLRHARLRGGGKPRAGQNEVEVNAIEQPELLGVERQLGSPRMERVDSPEKSSIQVNGAVMRGHPRRHLAFHRLQRGRCLRRRKILKQKRNADEIASASIERCDRVVERRRRDAVRDRVDLDVVPGKRHVERGCEMFGGHAIERRQAVRRVPGLQQRIDGVSGHGRRVRAKRYFTLPNRGGLGAACVPGAIEPASSPRFGRHAREPPCRCS